MQILAGDIGFSGPFKPSFYSRVVKWATKSRWSHCFPVVGEALGELSVLESELNICMVSFQREYVEKKDDYYEIWRPIKATPEQIFAAGHYCYMNFAEEPYGFLQPLWFLFRSLLRRVGLSANRNWSRTGLVCSGVLWWYLWALGGEYRALLVDTEPTNSSPEDLYLRMKARSDLFVFVTRREIADIA